MAVAPEVVVDPSERKHTEHSLGATLETLLTDSPPLVASLATSTQRHNHRSSVDDGCDASERTSDG